MLLGEEIPTAEIQSQPVRAVAVELDLEFGLPTAPSPEEIVLVTATIRAEWSDFVCTIP